MRTPTLAFVLLAAAACDPVISPPLDPDGGGGVDAGPPASCDGDQDGWIHPHPSCDAMRAGAAPDCDDARDDVHPGATTVCGDGAVNNCAALPAAAMTALGVEEVGLVADEPIYLTAAGGFVNNVGVALEPGTPPTAVVSSSESARNVLLLRASLGVAGAATPIPVTIPTTHSFANSSVNVIRRGPGMFRVATLGYTAGGTRQLGPLVGDFGMLTSGVTLATVARNPSCPSTSGNNAPAIIRGLNDSGVVYFEDEVSPGQLWGFATDVAQGMACKNLGSLVGANAEFGSQLYASGGLAVGRAGGADIWTWEFPLNYDDLHRYTPTAQVTGAMGILGGDTVAGEPVVLAYTSGGQTHVEGLQCTGLATCQRLTSGTIAGGATAFAFAPIGRGGAMISGLDDGTATTFQLRLVGEDGTLLAPDVAVPVGKADSFAFRLDAASVPPAIGRDYHELAITYAVPRTSSDQWEIRLAQARACTSR